MMQASQSVVLVILSLLLQLTGLIFAVLVDPYIRREHRNVMLITIALIFGLIVQNIVGFWMDQNSSMTFGRTVDGIFGYSVRPMILVMFFYIVSEKRKIRFAWILIGINTAIHLTALFSGICFSIDESNTFHRGPLGYSCHIVSGILLLYLLNMTIRGYHRVKKSESWIPVFNTLLIIASVILDSFVNYQDYVVSFLTVAVVSSSLFYYIWLHLQFVREHEHALRAEQRIQIMMTQIQPHFLYNTIATFKALCSRDPDRAADVADKFGSYLRQNLDTLNTTGCIPFQKELEHTKLYADIEMVRFDNIRVEYTIMDDDFTVPPLILQPMVENAIRHGVRIREQGIVQIITRRLENTHEIIIQDNGIGFDASAIEKAGSQHIGIRNVRERIENMCGGTLSIDSRIGIGTAITISLPAQEVTG